MKISHRRLSRQRVFIVQVMVIDALPTTEDEWMDFYRTHNKEAALEGLNQLQLGLGQFRLVEEIITRRTMDILTSDEESDE